MNNFMFKNNRDLVIHRRKSHLTMLMSLKLLGLVKKPEFQSLVHGDTGNI